MRPVDGAFNFQRFSIFLKSFWGILASFTAFLPTLIYFMNAAQIKESLLKDYYLFVPTAFVLLTIPFTFLFEDKLSNLAAVRKTAGAFFAFSICAIFAFIVIKNIYITNKNYVIPQTKDHGKIYVQERQNGKINMITILLPDTLNMTRHDKMSEPLDPTRIDEQKVNVLEVISLVTYTSSIILLAVAFSSLGVFYYSHTQHNNSS